MRGSEFHRGALALLALAAAVPAQAQLVGPVAVDGGRVEGAAHGEVGVFKGIPFAAAPVGELRWKSPQPVHAWSGNRAADGFGPDCLQLGAPSSPPSETLPPDQSEDCLYLNVWTAAESAAERRPVMVWIYGGGYRAGSTRLPTYDGAALARRGVVFVSVSYRVGPLGFMAHPALSAESQRHVSGNYGLLDQIAALDWVRRHIASFGGDPDRITIFGQSAGSMSTSYLASSPLATGKFHRIIAQTGSGFGALAPKPLEEAEAKGLAFGRQFGAETAEQLRALDAGKLVAAAGYASGTFQPIADGWVVPGELQEIYRRGGQNDVDLLLGSNDDESGENPSQTLAGYREGLNTLYGEDARRLLELHPASSDAEARAADRRVSTTTLGDYAMFGWARAQATTGTAPVRCPAAGRMARSGDPLRPWQPRSAGVAVDRPGPRAVAADGVLLGEFRRQRRPQRAGSARLADVSRGAPPDHGARRQDAANPSSLPPDARNSRSASRKVTPRFAILSFRSTVTGRPFK
jgi:para-nitrobenzyl esterase